MNLIRPLRLRAAGMLLVVVGAVFAVAAPALAHNGTGGSSSDYRITITGYSGDPTGVSLHVVQLGDRVELTREGANVVFVLGYEGEQYLRLDRDGVWENTNSPAFYLNADRFAATQPPAGITKSSTAKWSKLSTGNSVRWHDHRAHYMSTTPPDAVTRNPDQVQLVHSDHIDMTIDGRAVGADIDVSWLPKPERLNWMVAASVLGALVTAGPVLVPSLRRVIPVLAIVAGLASMLGQGAAVAPFVIGGVIISVAIAAALLAKPIVSMIAAVGAGALASMRLEVFEHELLAGWLPSVWQRLVIVVALALGFGIAASGLVTALSPTPVVASKEPDRVE
ncbi:MAG: hypothetical protein ABIR32_17325 [Ilumatobacteraceae bacterium]